MRAVFVGAGSLAAMTARLLVKRGHEVIIVEQDNDRIRQLSETTDCAFIHGDGSKPAILRETNPHDTDVLFCLAGNDQTNIISSLVGRSLGFRRVVTKIEDPEFEHICIELGLEGTIIPARTIGRFLADMLEGQDPLELSTMIRDEARVFSLVAQEADAGPAGDLNLPERSNIVCIYRGGKLIIPRSDEKIKVDDEIVIITHRDNLSVLHEKWGPQQNTQQSTQQDRKT